jgi:hypothetical protein
VARADLAGNQGVDLVAALPNQNALCILKDQAEETLSLSDNGAYIVTGINTNLGSVARPFPLRLIIHNPAGTGNAQLLQRVYCGIGAGSNYVVASSESALLPSYRSQARRISAAHLPWSARNTPFDLDGKLGPAAVLKSAVTIATGDHAANPFLHTYHPDHDNLNATFDGPPLTPESYAIQRNITMEVLPPANDFESLTKADQQIVGLYAETIKVGQKREFCVAGGFVLNRFSNTPTLATTP